VLDALLEIGGADVAVRTISGFACLQLFAGPIPIEAT
jgi:hypothetical protein